MMIKRSIIILFFWHLQGHSLVPAGQLAVSCHHNHFAKLIKKVVEFTDSAKQRETVPEYATSHNIDQEDAKKRFAPTGKLKCGNASESASIVGKNNTLVTAGHIFVDENTCARKANPTTCSFTVEGKPPVMISALKAIGITCQTKGEPNMDFAILTLKTPIEGITPYAIKPSDDGIQPRAVVAVGAYSIDFRRKDTKTGATTYPKHIQDCNIKRVYLRALPYSVGSDCAGSFGKSGGALLEPGTGRPVFLGMTIGSPFNKAEQAKERATGQAVRKPYDDKTWSDTGVSLTGVFYDELKKVIE